MRETDPPVPSAGLEQHCRWLLTSYHHWLNKPLVAGPIEPGTAWQRLFHMDAVLISHGTEADPVFNFANRRALALFESTWEQFTRLPSRFSAEPLRREERQRLLEAVRQRGYVEDYQGVRVTQRGRRFRVPRATVWNVVDEEGTYRGQAAMFRRWEWISESG